MNGPLLSVPVKLTATVLSVHDGDTLAVSATLATDPLFGLTLTGRIDVRLFGCNARELAMPGGPEAGAHLAALLPVGATCTVTVRGVDKFGGRLDAGIVTAAGVDVVAQMIADGYAAPWNGRGPKPLPVWPMSPPPTT